MHCIKEDEDELHFLFDCDSYHDLQKYNNMISYSYLQSLNTNFDSLAT